MNNWISVKDRLPDRGKYLVCCRDKDAEDARDIEIAWYDTKYIGSEFEFDCWSDPYDEIGLNCRGWVVTHWQPLPVLPGDDERGINEDNAEDEHDT